ncbi:MAG: hypothetical protein FWF90_11335 [Promicromonosporaceae bacterium]|nr:hypothetical protein [Promicromonosporaceae bacterium]
MTTQWTIDTGIVLDQANGQVALTLAGQQVQVVTRGTTTPYPIFDAGSLDPIASSMLTVSPIGTLPTFVIQTDTPEGLYLDWRDSGSGLQGGIGFEEVMRTIAVAARDSAATAVTSASASATAASSAQTAAEGAASSALASAAAAAAALAASVRTVNGVGPDASGNVTVATGSGGGTGGAVTSVAGKTGAVSLVKADVGLAQVDNTADTAKPVSTPQAAALSGKANTVHTHEVADVSGLQAALDSKAGLNGAVNASQVNAGTGIIAPSHLGTGSPTSALFLRGDGAWATPPSGGGGTGGAVNSVNGKTGDVTLTASDVSALPASTVLVTSVAGRNGAVTLAKGDVGLGSVDNTSDANKPVSTAQAAAIAAKADDASVLHTSGNETAAGVKTFTSPPVVPDGSFTPAKVTGLAAALAAAVTGTGITAIVAITQAAYNALGTKSSTTLYVING